jgi:sulfatase maturation enzyme AslB (radical SAM superfamily)
MCPVNLPTGRKKQIMDEKLFRSIIDSLIPYIGKIEMMDLFCLGEPLLDPNIPERIRYVKDMGFRNVAISTNANLLDTPMQRFLLETGIDTIIFSIDGVNKKTHESIRRGANFEKVVSNCESIIQIRNDGNFRTRFVFRFIKQELNKDEWPAFIEYWKKRISQARNDIICAYDVHSWDSGNDSIELMKRTIDHEIDKIPCHVIFNVLYILADGTVPLCSEDWIHANYRFGNVEKMSPIDIFNSSEFNRIREIHVKGTKNTITQCSKCTVLYSERTKKTAS